MCTSGLPMYSTLPLPVRYLRAEGGLRGRHQILAKLSVTSRTEAVALAVEHKLVG